MRSLNSRLDRLERDAPQPEPEAQLSVSDMTAEELRARFDELDEWRQQGIMAILERVRARLEREGKWPLPGD